MNELQNNYAESKNLEEKFMKHLLSFINTTTCKLMYSKRQQISGCLHMVKGVGREWRAITKGHEVYGEC